MNLRIYLCKKDYIFIFVITDVCMIFRYLFILFVFYAHSQNNGVQINYLVGKEENLEKQRNLRSLDSTLLVWNNPKKNEVLSAVQQFYLAKQIASSYQNLGFTFKALAFYQISENLLESGVVIKNDEKAKFYNDLSAFYYAISNNKLFKKNLIKAVEIVEKDPEQFTDELIEAYEKLINNYLEYGDVDSAKLYLQKLKNLSKFSGTQHSVLFHKFFLANHLYHLRIALYEKDFTVSDKTYNELKAYFGLIKDKTFLLSYYADATNYYAEAIFNTGRVNEAFKLLEESIVLHKKVGDKLSLVTVYSYYSYFARESKNYNWADQSIDEAIYITEPDNFTDLAGLYINKGIIYFLEENYKKSELYFNKAHELIKRIANTDFYLLSYNIEISKKYFEIYEKTGNRALLQASFSSYKYSVKQFQDFYENDLFNPLLAEFKNNITEGLLNLGLKSDTNLIETIELIENIQSKFLLKNYLVNNSFANEQLINELSEIKSLKLKLATVSSLNRDLNTTNIKNQIQSLEKRLVEKHPNFNSIFNPRFDFKKFIEKNTDQLIRYYSTSTSLFGIYIDNKDKIHLKRIGEVSRIKKQVSDLVLAVNHKTSIKQQSQKIFTTLLKPFDVKTSQVTIIANSFLNELPFELLVDEKGQYLVENFEINYSNSLPLYEIQRNHKNSEPFKLAIFQPNYNNKDLAILPFAEKEALFLQKTFNSTLFSSQNASKENFIKGVSHFNVYHLSMHAIIDGSDEEVSRLLFHDENFYFSDFYSQNLPLDLVVLSACETGVGKFIEGEGLMSLSRAFTYSGVASTVHSLWEIPDKQAYELMQLFYANLNKGLSKSKALQQAKVEYLKTCNAEELKHPYYWSGFVLNGNPKALLKNKSYGVEILIGVLLFFIGLIYFLKFRK